MYNYCINDIQLTVKLARHFLCIFNSYYTKIVAETQFHPKTVLSEVKYVALMLGVTSVSMRVCTFTDIA